MYKLYWDPGSASLAPHVMLEEIAAPHELLLIDLTKGEHLKPQYLKINPHGRIPAFVDGETVMYESAAICLYLAEKHPEARLAPAPGTAQRMQYLQWMAYLTNTVQEALMRWFHPEHYAPPEAQDAVKQHAEQRLDQLWAFLDGQLAKQGPYLLGDTCSTPDIFLTMLTRWSRNMARPAAGRANLRRLVELVRARPAYQRMLKAEGIVHPLPGEKAA
jgi:glutathione S-transferase